ncbi:hypothetical protein AwPolaro_10120 [Polaromonas sp.]|nr:hypothetical protein AwPolaro_10120 [Polaromonas sp.]
MLCEQEYPAHIERTAQQLVGKLITRAPSSGDAGVGVQTDKASKTTKARRTSKVATPTVAASADMQTVDINSIEDSQARAVGVEHVALHAIAQLKLVDKLTELGVNGVMRACILGNIIGRMAAPASELATWDWLQPHSAGLKSSCKAAWPAIPVCIVCAPTCSIGTSSVCGKPILR